MQHCLQISGSLTKQDLILEEGGASQEQSLLKERPTLMRTTDQVRMKNLLGLLSWDKKPS